MPTANRVPRVLFVATSGGEGGIERYSVRLALLLRARGVPVTYACRPGGFLEAHCAAHGVPTVPWAVRNSGDLGSSFALARLLRVHVIDVVHVHSRRDYVPAVLGARLAGRRLLIHAHLIRRLGEPPGLAGRFFRWGAAGVIVVSEAVRERLRAEHHFPPEFVHLLPNGVDTAAFAGADGAAQRRAWGIPAEALVVGMMGRLNAKGQDALLGVAPILAARFPTVRFALVGPEGASGDKERLRDQAQALGVTGRVVLPGMTEDVPAAMAAFDVLAHLPADESFGLALVEAMAAGRPAVATDIGGCCEVVLDGVTGMLVRLGDADALASALSALLGDPALRHRMGEAGRERAGNEFSLDRQVERLCDLYGRLAPGSQARPSRPRRAYAVPALLGLTVLMLTLTALYHHSFHRHVHHADKNTHSHLGAGPDPHVPRGRGRAAPAQVQALLRPGGRVRRADADAQAGRVHGGHVRRAGAGAGGRGVTAA